MTDLSSSKRTIRALLTQLVPDPASPYHVVVQRAVRLAQNLQQRAQELQTPQERKQQMEFNRMLESADDRATLTQMTDQAFRSKSASRAADQLIHILDVQGVPRFFSPLERTLLRGFQSFGGYVPGVAVPLVKEKMRHETANVILPAEPEILRQHLDARREEGVRMNVNYLGEAILGEQEAQRRLEQYLAALQLPEIEVASIKISTIYSQIRPIAREHTIRHVCDRLELLYRAAARGRFERIDGTIVPKFVYLDMEEYRDMWLTAEAFMRTLDRPGLQHFSAGIVLQAYVPDSYQVQQRLTEWARNRLHAGGAPIILRIVKGANLEMERVEASLRGWPLAPFSNKLDTDANYKKMLHYGLHAENRDGVRLGIGSHNLFEIAYAIALAYEQGALANIHFEMLEGMANPQRRALHELVGNLLLYAPACDRDNFINAIGYLLRRLDENTGEHNFLRHAFHLTVDSPAWRMLEADFLRSCLHMDELHNEPHRQQDRGHETFEFDNRLPQWTEFTNEPDTDFGLSQNASWAESIVARWRPRCDQQAVKIPLFVDGDLITASREMRLSLDPSRPGVIVAQYSQANQDDVQRAVACANDDPDGWRRLSPHDRQHALRRVAVELRKSRGELIGAAIANGGKTVMESDPEVSEAIDFVELYSAAARYFTELPGIQAEPRGVVVVVSPWNFPIAIPCGGISAALAAGNTVILKPASQTVLVAHELCQCFYRAGISRRVLQLLPCAGQGTGQTLVAHPDVDTVVLTGGTATALQMLEHKPSTRLLAETGGKNATIVTALADRDLAIKHLLDSAFSHSGQKCSATSLLLLEGEVYDDPKFREALVDAVASMPVGSAWQLENRMGPLISAPTGDLERGLKELEPGESWALLPERLDNNPALYSPGIKWDVQRNSFTHCTELFGPVLGVMRFNTLHEAIEIVNETGYGLTSGLQSLDDREQRQWLQSIRAGNLYVNRGTTGAIVLRQPFGGVGRSSVGPGMKAGGPNYVAQLMRFIGSGSPTTDGRILDERLRSLAAEIESWEGAPDEIKRMLSALRSYDYQARIEFRREHDHFQLLGQDNIRRYLPVPRVHVRVHPDDTPFEIVARVAAARAAGSRVVISMPPDVAEAILNWLHDATESWAADIEFLEQTDDDLLESFAYLEVSRLRYADPSRVPDAIRQAVPGMNIHIADEPVLEEGRVELLRYVEEQSLSIDYHRYGNLGSRK